MLEVGFFCYNRNVKHMALDLGPHVAWQCEGPQVDDLWQWNKTEKSVIEGWRKDKLCYIVIENLANLLTEVT